MLWVVSAFAATTLAVLPFDNHSGDPTFDALGKGIADMMVTDLARVKQLELVERARIQEVLAEVKLGKDGFVDPKSAARAGRGLGADFLVVGAINAVSPVLRIDTRVVDVRSGRITWTAAAQGQQAAFFEVEKDLVLTLLEEMEIEVSAREAMQVGRVATESFDALLSYSDGLQALDSGAVAEAREKFRRAVDRDGGFGAAKQAIEAARARVESSEVVRDEAYSEGLKQALPLIAGFRTGDVSEAELEALALRLASQIHGFRHADQRRIALAFLELDLPESVELRFSPPTPVNAWAIQALILADHHLQRGDELVTWGQVFLERYPTSPYFGAQKVMVDRQLERLAKAQAAREAGRLEQLTRVWEEKRRYRLCDREPDQRLRVEACRSLWTWKREHAPDTWTRRVLDDIVDGLAPYDPVLGAEVLALWTRVLPDPPHPSDRAPIEERAERKTYARDRLQRARREPSAATLGSAIEAHLKIGDDAQVSSLMRELQQAFPDDAFTFLTRWRVARAYGDADAMESALLEAREAGHAIQRSHEDALERVEKIREKRHEVDFAEAWASSRLAQELQREGLLREAAERLEEVVDGHPKWTEEARPSIIQKAARAWNQVYEVGALERSIRLRKQLVAEYPDTDEARAAATWLDRMRVE